MFLGQGVKQQIESDNEGFSAVPSVCSPSRSPEILKNPFLDSLAFAECLVSRTQDRALPRPSSGISQNLDRMALHVIDSKKYQAPSTEAVFEETSSETFSDWTA